METLKSCLSYILPIIFILSTSKTSKQLQEKSLSYLQSVTSIDLMLWERELTLCEIIRNFECLIRGGIITARSDIGRKVLICGMKNSKSFVSNHLILHTELKSEFTLFFVATLIIAVNYVKLPKALFIRKHWIIITTLQFLPSYSLKVVIGQVKHLFFTSPFQINNQVFFLRSVTNPCSQYTLPRPKNPLNPTLDKKIMYVELLLLWEAKPILLTN